MSSSTRIAAILLAGIFATATPASALFVALAPAPIAIVPADPCVGSTMSAAATCSGILLLNGDAAGSQAKAFEAATAAYGNTANARIREIYAHQLAIVQNPVLNPGFLLGNDSWSVDEDVTVSDGALVLPAEASASQVFGQTSSFEELNAGIPASAFWAPDALELFYSGEGNASVTLADEFHGVDWTITVPLAPSQGALARFDLLAYAEDLEIGGLPTPEIVPASEALATSALIALEITADDSATLTLDDVILDGVSYGPDPALALELDAPVPDGADELLVLLPPNPASATLLSAHDGYAIVIVPLDFVPTLLADGPQAAVGNAAGMLSGDWTFFAALVAMTPSGPVNEDIASGTISASGPAVPLTRTSLSEVGATGAAFAAIYESLGLGDLQGGVATIEDVTPAGAARIDAVLVPEAPRLGVADVAGSFNYGKLLDPARAFADVSDPVAENVLVGRSALGGATYARERRSDGNDGFVASIAPAGWKPLADGTHAQALLIPDGLANYHFDVSFVDYAGESADGASRFFGLVPADDLAAFSGAIGEEGLAAWHELASYSACSWDFENDTGATCDQAIANSSAASARITIPFSEIVNLTNGLGGAFVPVAFTAIDGALTDVELGATPTRGFFSLAANELLAQADDFEQDVGAATVGPYWLYAAADAASQVPTLVRFAPAADAADGTAVIITPQAIDTQRGIERLLPDALGNYVFDVEFTEYGADGVYLRSVLPTNVAGDDFYFQLADLQAADPRGPTAPLWNITANAIVTPSGNKYIVSIPAWEIPRTPTDAPTQALTAWSSIDRAHRNTTGARVLDADTGEAGGYYNAPKVQDQDVAIADALDGIAGSFLIDHSLEVYQLAIEGAAAGSLDKDTGRGEAVDLVFRVINEGTFTEEVLLALDNVDTDKVIAELCVPVCEETGGLTAQAEPSITLEAGETYDVVVRVTPKDTMANHETSSLDLVATIAHAVPTADGGEVAAVLAGSVTVDPFAFTLSPIPTQILRDVDPGQAQVTITNTGVADSFTFTGAAAAGFTHDAPDGSLAVGRASNAQTTFVFGVGPTQRFGTTGSASLTAHPTHSTGTGDDVTTTVAINVPGSSLTAARVTPPGVLPGQAGTLVFADFTLDYEGPYDETIHLTATHENANWASRAITIEEVGGNSATGALDVTFTGLAEPDAVGVELKTIRISFLVPTDRPFDEQDTVRIKYSSNEPRSSIGRTAAGPAPVDVGTFTVETLTADLQLAGNATLYALPGETVTQGFVATYEGEFDAEFDFALSVTPASLASAVTPRQSAVQQFDGDLQDPPTVVRTLLFDVAFPNDLAYGSTITLTLTTSDTPNTVGWPDAELPTPKTSTAGTFSFLAPTIEFEDDAPRAFRNDVDVTHSITIAQNQLTGAQAAQWDLRPAEARSITYTIEYEIDSGTWDDQLLSDADATIQLGRGAEQAITLVSTPDNIVEAATFEFWVNSTNVQKQLKSAANVVVAPYLASDFALHSVLLGCYGASAADCDVVSGPIQAVTTHDAPESSYSRAYLLTAVILRGTTPSYVAFDDGSADLALSNISAALHVDASPVDAAQAGDHRDATEVRGDENATFASSISNGQVIGLRLAGADDVPAMMSLLWDSDDVASGDLEWYLTHLGTLSLEVTVDLHGLLIEDHYDPLRAIFPLVEAEAEAGAVVTTDKDDPDGDGYATAAELRGNSNPLLRSSYPFADDDEDASTNARDTIPLVNEACLQQDLQDADQVPSCAMQPGVAGPSFAATPAAAGPFGPGELAPHVMRLLGAYHVPER